MRFDQLSCEKVVLANTALTHAIEIRRLKIPKPAKRFEFTSLLPPSDRCLIHLTNFAVESLLSRKLGSTLLGAEPLVL